MQDMSMFYHTATDNSYLTACGGTTEIKEIPLQLTAFYVEVGCQKVTVFWT